MTSRLLIALSILGYGFACASKAPRSSLYQDYMKRQQQEKVQRQAAYQERVKSQRSRTIPPKQSGVAPLSAFPVGSVNEAELLSPHDNACIMKLKRALQDYIWSERTSLETIKESIQSITSIGAIFNRNIEPDLEDDGLVVHRQWRSVYQWIEHTAARSSGSGTLSIYNRLVEVHALLNSWLNTKMTISQFPTSTEIKLYHAIQAYAYRGTTGTLGLEGIKTCLAANADIQTPYVWTQVQDYVAMCALPEVQGLRLSILEHTKQQRAESEKYNNLPDIQARWREIQELLYEQFTQNKPA